MKDLLLVLSIFTNIKTYGKISYNKNDDSNMKYALCFFPVVGVILGIVLGIWACIAEKCGINSLIMGIVSVGVTALIVGNIHLGEVTKPLGWLKTPILIIYAVVLWAFFALGGIRGAFVAGGIFTLTRVMTILFIFEKSILEAGIYKSLVDNGRKIITPIITIVWLMATVAYIEIQSIVYFIFIMITEIIILFIFNKRAKKENIISDYHINCFIVICEIVVFIEIIVLNFISRVIV